MGFLDNFKRKRTGFRSQKRQLLVHISLFRTACNNRLDCSVAKLRSIQQIWFCLVPKPEFYLALVTAFTISGTSMKTSKTYFDSLFLFFKPKTPLVLFDDG